MKRILVLDAEPVIRKLVAAILERAGYEVVVVDGFDAARELIPTWQPALVITNVSLPRYTGHEAMQEIKRLYPDIPVLMCSGLPDVEVIEQWRDEAGFDVFPKPFRAEQLVQKVREMLESA